MFDSKRPAENVVLEFDFTKWSVSVALRSMTVSVSYGTADANPTALLSGAAQVQGAKVLQRVVGGNVGTHYKIACEVLGADGVSIYVLDDVLPVLNPA